MSSQTFSPACSGYSMNMVTRLEAVHQLKMDLPTTKPNLPAPLMSGDLPAAEINGESSVWHHSLGNHPVTCSIRVITVWPLHPRGATLWPHWSGLLLNTDQPPVPTATYELNAYSLSYSTSQHCFWPNYSFSQSKEYSSGSCSWNSNWSYHRPHHLEAAGLTESQNGLMKTHYRARWDTIPCKAWGAILEEVCEPTSNIC